MADTTPTYALESTFTGLIAGIDEAGRGPWAGPVVAAAVILDARRPICGINDSKKLPALKRELLYDEILAHGRAGVGIATAAEIDTLNILQATLLAMSRAVECLGIAPDIALVDGNCAPKLACRVETVIGGDAQCLSIAAASIVAKVTRDRIMRELAADFPGYGWERNAGYGTAAHQQALMYLGVTPYHRRSFAPIRTLLEVTELACQ